MVLLNSRWLLVATAVLVESVGGLGYIFSVYSDRLKTEFDLEQQQVDLLGTLSNLASTFGLHIGLLQDWAGPTPVLLLGGLLGVAGWLPLHFALARSGGWICPYWLLAIMSVLQGHQMLITDVAVVPAVARSFPRQRGLALGLVKSFVGLSGSIVTQVYLGLYAPDIAGFVLFIAVTVGVCAAVGMLLVRERAPPAVEDDVAVQRTFVAGYVLTALLATQLVGAALAGQLVPGLGGGHFKLAMTAVTAALLAATIGMLAVQQDAPQPPVPATAEPLLADTTVQKAAEVAASSRGGEAAAGLKEFSLLAAVCTLDFWILWVGFFGSSGAGLVFINNLGQIVPALGGAAVANVSTLVSLLSVCNCAGRLLCGALGDWALASFGTPRPVVFGWFMVLMAVAMGLLAIGTPATLYLATAAAGVSYGGLNGITPPICTELFGLKSFGAIYCANGLAEGTGSYVFATLLFSTVYNAAIDGGGGGGGSASSGGSAGGEPLECFGKKCFLATAGISAASCMFCAGLMIWLGCRSRSRYVKLYPAYYPKEVSAGVQ